MTNQQLWYRISGPDPNLRVGDADREQVAGRLRKSHAEGRLDLSEFQQRLEQCYAAKTLGELRELVRDLPRSDEPEARRPVRWLVPVRWGLSPLAWILIVLLVASAASGHGVFWLWIPIAFLCWRSFWWRRWRSVSGARHRTGDWI
jgi:Domain of unknown function (DUF1707)